ncbi:unnamed protein product [Schistocephalus solidus]|uniref:CUB domain-containing protein n=1 Tax=Schistocephalus solidus TaxID=70667 RepID=A0A183SNS3_SCHSO|nr:unnamed protein product [Schistocephalus solidus]
MKGDEGKISSLGYPGNYPANRTCFWRITVPVGFFSGNTCQFDYVKVYDGIINNSPMLKKLCGAKLPTPILSTGNTMGVLFVSNDRIQKIGFSAKYQKGKLLQVTETD